MRYIPFVIYLLLIGLYRTLLVDFLTIGGAQLYLTALIVIVLSLNKNYLTALWFGFAAGIVFDALNPSYLGVQIIILSLIGIGTAQAKERFNLESLKSLIFLVALGLAIFSIPYTLIYATSGISEFGGVFLRSTIPSIFYTLVAAWLYFMIHSGRISFKKLKSLF
ncbi:MAG: rod shape-determining protein MreD [candidate division Zixibacteria bacterium]